MILALTDPKTVIWPDYGFRSNRVQKRRTGQVRRKVLRSQTLPAATETGHPARGGGVEKCLLRVSMVVRSSCP